MKITDPLDEKFELLIINYFTGSISEDELSTLCNWINENPQNKRHFASLEKAWLLAGYKKDLQPALPADLLVKVRQKLNGNHDSRISRVKTNSFQYLKIAASWAVFLAIGSVMTLWLSTRHQTNLTAASAGKVEIFSPLGAKSRIMLPDSTLIWLNAGTTISYDQNYGMVSRIIELDGEAYFDVHSDSRHAFIVHAREVDIHAIGTRFNVKAYSDETTLTATLEEGKINITIPGLEDKVEKILLNPNEIFIYHITSDSISDEAASIDEQSLNEKINSLNSQKVQIIPDVRTELFTSWKDTRWIIEREPFNTLVPMLERRYNMKIIFLDQEIKNFKFTGTVENENIEQLLNAIRFTAPIEYSVEKDTVRLYLDTDANEKFKDVLSNRK